MKLLESVKLNLILIFVIFEGIYRSPGEGNGNPLQYSCLENSMDGGAWWATVHGIAKNRTRLSDFTYSLTLEIKQLQYFKVTIHHSLSKSTLLLAFLPIPLSLSNHFILCCPLLPPSIFPTMRVLSNDSSNQVAKELEFQLQYQSFQWIFRTDFL